MWTHFLGFLLFVGLFVYTFYWKFPNRMFEVVDEMKTHLPQLHVREYLSHLGDDIKSRMPHLPHLPEFDLSNHNHWLKIDWEEMKTSMVRVEHDIEASVLVMFPFLDSGNHTLSITPVVARLSAMYRDVDTHRLMFGIFLVGACCCLCFSFIFHTFLCHSVRWCNFLSRLDYAGIALLIAASSFPAVYYGHYCAPWWQRFWLVIICFCCLSGMAVSMLERFSSPEWRAWRAIIFVGCGLSGVFPLFHQFYVQQGVFTEDSTVALTAKLFLMAFLYILGAVLFATRIPERWFPGKCDIWFHSHQLHHCCVVAAACIHWSGLVNSFEYRMKHPCPAVIA